MSYSMYPGPRRRTYSNGQVVLISIVVLLVMLGSGLLVYSSVTTNIAATNNSATATAQANANLAALKATNNAVVSSDVATAQVALTAQAQANMTATAQAYAHVAATANAQASATAAARATSIAQAYASATAQAYADRDPYPPFSGNLVLSDPLSDNSQGHGWDVYSRSVNNNCLFTAGGYESTTQSSPGAYYDTTNNCAAEKTNFANFTLQADVTIVKGDCGGISFRGNSATRSGYALVICASNTETTPAGDWAVRDWAVRDWASGNYYGNIAEASSPAILKNLGQTNVLAVVAVGSSLTFYANGQKLTTITNSAYTTGQIGLESSGDLWTLDEVTFRNVKVWTV